MSMTSIEYECDSYFINANEIAKDPHKIRRLQQPPLYFCLFHLEGIVAQTQATTFRSTPAASPAPTSEQWHNSGADPNPETAKSETSQGLSAA
jgi:hypothetical protein